MSQTIFGATTPAQTDNANGRPITVGTVFSVDVNGSITDLRQYMPATQAGGALGRLYTWTNDTTGSLVASATYAGIVENAWNTIALTSSYTYTASSLMLTATYFPQGHYVSSGNFFGTDLVSGNITALADDSNIPRHNGKFNDGADGYPAQNFNKNCYFSDIVFVPNTVSGTITITTAAAIVHMEQVQHHDIAAIFIDAPQRATYKIDGPITIRIPS